MNDLGSFDQAAQISSGQDDRFDRHILGRMVLHAAFEAKKKNVDLGSSLGLRMGELSGLLNYLHLDVFYLSSSEYVGSDADDEEVMLRELLVHNCVKSVELVQWLPAILAHRSMEPNHLWEDLGLAQRPDLTRLLMHYFPGLACKNTRNMRWKRFLYRSLCEAEGFTMCPSPTCDACSEFNVCYGDESGEAVMARNQRAANLAEAEQSVA